MWKLNVKQTIEFDGQIHIYCVIAPSTDNDMIDTTR